MILIGSRYQNAEVQYILDSRTGLTRPTVSRGSAAPSRPNVTIQWHEGTRVDHIGREYAGLARDWWAIFDMNSEFIDPLSIPSGATVAVR